MIDSHITKIFVTRGGEKPEEENIEDNGNFSDTANPQWIVV